MLGMVYFLAQVLDGQVVAKLPFEPISLVRSMSHRNLAGEDFYDCAYMFIYVLCNISLRPIVQKAFGNAPPAKRGPSLFPDDMEATK